ncbi:MAG: 4Fe-4S binding protein [Candidatus Margulisbacteria bacterium]|nr:4Fe-4S binding protein [Candidatus Margulisiibacteriota bacterium]
MADNKKAVVDPNICTGCGICVDVCPSQAIELVDGLAKVNSDKCNGDVTCVDACPVQAIAMQ